MNSDWIVTIGREFCSGGAQTAHKLALALGIPYYDKEIVDKAANIARLSSEIVEQHDEKPTPIWPITGYQYNSYWYLDDPSLMLPVGMRISEAQSDAIRSFAEEGACVIVGRGADYVLRNRKRVLNVFIRADMETRVARAVSLYHLSDAEARKLIKKTDSIRSKYYTGHTGRPWGAPEDFDIVLDAGKLGTDAAAAILEKAYRILEASDR